MISRTGLTKLRSVLLAVAPATALLVVGTAAFPADPGQPPGSNFDGVWEPLILDPGGGGTPTRPPKRMFHGQVHDPLREQMVVFGGWTGSVPLNDLWALDLDPASPTSQTWRGVVTSGSRPAARWGHSVILDSARDRLIVFGGQGQSSRLGDVWALSLASDPPTWTPLAPGGFAPSSRLGAMAIHDPEGDRMIVFGGHDGVANRNDVWELSLDSTPTWSLLGTSGVPPTARNAGVAVFDEARSRMVLYGGFDGVSFLNDAWELSLAGTPTWTQIVAGGLVPPALRTHAAVIDPLRDRLIVFGGERSASSNGMNDLWTLGLGTGGEWDTLSADGRRPSRRWGHRAILDPAEDRLVVFGGVDLEDWRNDTHAVTLGENPLWTELEPFGSFPEPRHSTVAAFDRAGDRLMIYGGLGTSVALPDVWELDVGETPAWRMRTVFGPSPGRRFAAAHAVDEGNRRLLVFGGFDGVAFRNDAWSLELSEPLEWTPLAPAGDPPSPRNSLPAVFDPGGNRLVVVGGFDGVRFLEGLWVLELGPEPRWVKLEPMGRRPAPRRDHTLVLDRRRDRAILFGGFDGANGLNDVWVLSLRGKTRWRELQPQGEGPDGRWQHRAIFDETRNRMLVFGGVDFVDWRNDVWELSFQGRETWKRLEPTGSAPPRRTAHAAVFDENRNRLVIFGGLFSSFFFNDVWALDLVEPGPMPTIPVGADRDVLPAPHAERAFSLEGAVPNPSVGGAMIAFTLPSGAPATLRVFDLRGRTVFEEAVGERGPGRHVVRFGRTLDDDAPAPGLYFVRLTQGERRAERKLVLVP